MKVLITGICGFVGRWIAQGIAEFKQDVQLIGFDNLCRPGSELNRADLKQLGAQLFHGDLRCPSDLSAVPAADWVIDCAATTSVLAGTPGHASSRQLHEHNLIGTLNLLEYCRQHQSGLILLSTSRVYSIHQLRSVPLKEVDNAYCPDLTQDLPAGVSEHGIAESFSTAAPISIYGATKLSAEVMAAEYALAYGFPLRINRCGVMAGAGQFGRPDQGIFAFWIHSHYRRRPLKYIGCKGTGYQVRDCLHPIDVAQLVCQQIDCGMDDSKPTVVNLGGGMDSACSLNQLTAWCDKKFGSHPVLASNEERPFDLPWVVLDSQLAKEAWNWQPQRTVESILEEIAHHAEENPDWLEQSL